MVVVKGNVRVVNSEFLSRLHLLYPAFARASRPGEVRGNYVESPDKFLFLEILVSLN